MNDFKTRIAYSTEGLSDEEMRILKDSALEGKSLVFPISSAEVGFRGQAISELAKAAGFVLSVTDNFVYLMLIDTPMGKAIDSLMENGIEFPIVVEARPGKLPVTFFVDDGVERPGTLRFVRKEKFDWGAEKRKAEHEKRGRLLGTDIGIL